jgi:hypothetical protein
MNIQQQFHYDKLLKIAKSKGGRLISQHIIIENIDGHVSLIKSKRNGVRHAMSHK